MKDVTLTEASHILNISPVTLYRWGKESKIKLIPPSPTMVSGVDIERIIKERQKGAEPNGKAN